MSNTVEVRAPAEQTEGTRSQILRWLKQVGDPVAENEPLIEIETDKVTVEVAAPGAGTLSEILKHEQDEIAPGDLLGHIAVAAAGAPQARPSVPRAAGGGESRAAAAPAATRSSTPGQLSPAVRRLLAEHGLSPAAVPGTGPAGRIMVEDVLRAAAAGGGGASPPGVAVKPAASSVAPEGGPRSHTVPHSAVRRRIAEHMVHSLLHTAPHVTSVFEADMSAVVQDRARQREPFARQGVPLTLTAYFVRAVVAAIRAVPEANSRWTEGGLELYDSMNIGIATAVEGTGLVVPVLHDAETRDLLETARGIHEVVARARAGKLAPADVRGGTFTISNHGVSGSLFAAPIIINQPQSAILGVGKLEQRPVVKEGTDGAQILIQPRCYVSLTIDHRVMDGHQANRFLAVFVEQLASWPA